ncbi:hypothetical protein FACS189431_7100 [Alphaproteobacteria bacterium]|nr:hypothetical protein FACS189431_7100 [Alphaproteobacteria bacterium]
MKLMATTAARRAARKWTTALLAVSLSIIMAVSVLLAGCSCSRQPDPELPAPESEAVSIPDDVEVYEADGIQYRQAVDENGIGIVDAKGGPVFNPAGVTPGGSHKVTKAILAEKVGPLDLRAFATTDSAPKATIPAVTPGIGVGLLGWFAPINAYAATPFGPAEAYAYGRQLFEATNILRAEHDPALPPFEWDDAQFWASYQRVQEAAVFFSHYRLDGTSYKTAYSELGIDSFGSGENVAGGQETPEEAMAAWLDDSAHAGWIYGSSKYFAASAFPDANDVLFWHQAFTGADFLPGLSPSEQVKAAGKEVPDPLKDTAPVIEPELGTTEPGQEPGPTVESEPEDLVEGVFGGNLITDPSDGINWNPNIPIDGSDLVTVTPNPDGSVDVTFPVTVGPDVNSPIIIGDGQDATTGNSNGNAVAIRPVDPDRDGTDDVGWVFVPGIPGVDTGNLIPSLPATIDGGDKAEDLPIVGVDQDALQTVLDDITAKRAAGDFDGADALANEFLHMVENIADQVADAKAAVEAEITATAAAREEAARAAAEQDGSGSGGTSGSGATTPPPSGPNPPASGSETVTPPSPTENPQTPKKVIVPDLVGLSQADAENTLRELGLKWKITEKISTLYPSGTVCLAPEAGKEFNEGDEIIIVVSQGPGPS